LSEYEKKEVSGILGELDSQEKKELILEVLNSIDYNMIVTPKEIDFLIDKLSETIAHAIDKSLHTAIKD
jgi:spore protease